MVIFLDNKEEILDNKWETLTFFEGELLLFCEFFI